MAAFKAHAKVGVWGEEKPVMVDATTVAELPSAKAFSDQLKAAAQRIAASGKATSKKPAAKKPAARTPAAKKKTQARPT
jgi:hypothetical protein